MAEPEKTCPSAALWQQEILSPKLFVQILYFQLIFKTFVTLCPGAFHGQCPHSYGPLALCLTSVDCHNLFNNHCSLVSTHCDGWFFVNLSHARVILGEEVSAKEMPPLDRPVGMSVGHCLD